MQKHTRLQSYAELLYESLLFLPFYEKQIFGPTQKQSGRFLSHYSFKTLSNLKKRPLNYLHDLLGFNFYIFLIVK